MIRSLKVLIFVLLMVFVASNANAETIDLPKTGQTISDAPGDDGDLEKGVAWPSPRFTDNGDGTVMDNLTGLIWLQDANCDGAMMAWSNALAHANGLYDGCSDCGGTDYDCGLSDGSSAEDWRLPNVKELQSLIDFGEDNPVLPSGHPFTGVQSASYWSSTTNANDTSTALRVFMSDGSTVSDDKSSVYYVWPVRDATAEEEGVSECFIATAAYGSPIEPNVNILLEFRDRFLRVNVIGKGFVRLYNTYSPPIADFIAKHDSLRMIVRVSLLPIVGLSWVAFKIGLVSTMALMLFFVIGIFGLVRVRKKPDPRSCSGTG
jgi:hypothetical protein